MMTLYSSELNKLDSEPNRAENKDLRRVFWARAQMQNRHLRDQVRKHVEEMENFMRQMKGKDHAVPVNLILAGNV